MKKSIRSSVLLLCPLAAMSAVNAEPSLSLTTSADLPSLNVGAPVTIGVLLAGLPSGDHLDLLAATVRGTTTVLGTPTSVTAGSVIPSPLANPSDFVIARNPGVADASFYTSSPLMTARISSNGVFVTIQFVPVHSGSGQLTIDFADALKFNVSDPPNPLEQVVSVGSPLAFTAFCPADFNRSGSSPTVQDLFDFLAGYFGGDARADFNGSGAIGVQDIFDFLAAYFTACA